MGIITAAIIAMIAIVCVDFIKQCISFASKYEEFGSPLLADAGI